MGIEISTHDPENFRYKHEYYGTIFPAITIGRVSIHDEIRLLSQKEKMPKLSGEFVIDKTLAEMHDRRNGEAIIRTLEAHAAFMGFRPVYGGYRAPNLYMNGVLFGEESSERALEVIAKERKFNAVTAQLWREVLGYAKNNPFDHMTRGGENKYSPAIIAFDTKLLNQLDDRLFIPKDDMGIEETVSAVYYPKDAILNKDGVVE